MNYTDEQTAHIKEQYLANPNRVTVEKLADELNKSVKVMLSHAHTKY